MMRLSMTLGMMIVCATPVLAFPLGFGIGLRLGGSTTKPSGLLVGVDAAIPALSLGRGLKTRVDFDTWGQPTSGWDRTSGGKAVAVCQIASTLGGYYGAGLGYSRIRTGGVADDGPEIKLVGGVNILGLGVEANAHIGKRTVWTGMLRLRF